MANIIDINLLRILKTRKDYNKVVPNLPLKLMDEKVQLLIKDFGKYFKTFPSHDSIDLQTFLPRFQQWHQGFDADTFTAFTRVLQQIISNVDEDTRNGILGQVYELDLATKLANAAAQYQDGDLSVPLSDLITSYVDTYKVAVGARLAEYIDGDDIDSILETELDYSGISWRLGCLNAHMRGLRGGDMGIVAARPDQGKTTFFTSEITHMAPQLPEDKNIVWLNNEGSGKRILPRLYQSAIGCTLHELKELRDRGKLRAAYADAVGRTNRIRIHDIHGFNVGQVEAILEKSNAGIIIFDMLDNVTGFQGESRTDLQLECMYQWARERAVKYDAVVLASSQISQDGDGQAFPTQTMLKDSKTGKQGACDFIIMIGAKNEAGYENIRYIGTPKNKLRREGMRKDPLATVNLNVDTARYTDPEDSMYGTMIHKPQEQQQET